MISHFLKLEWKQFFRSASFGKNVGLKILMGFFAIWMLLGFLSLGVGTYFFLKEQYPAKDPFIVANKFVVFLLVFDLIIRYLMQKIPVMDIKPMLILPIKKNKLVNYILTKSVFSFFNFSFLILYIPFAIVLISKGYNYIGVLAWTFFMLALTICINFINFLINKNNIALGFLVLFLGSLWLSFKYQIFDMTNVFGKVFYLVYENPLLSFIGLFLVALFYYLNFSINKFILIYFLYFFIYI